VTRGLWDYLHDPGVARNYDASLAGTPLFAVDQRFVERHCPRPGRLLDLGCGTGRLLLEFGRRGYDVVGVDLSAEMLAVAQAKATAAGVGAVKWTEDQEIVWPTDKNRAEGMKFSTEEFVDAVIKDVTGKYKLDPERVFTLTWSSSGPAAYAASLRNKTITGSFIAMSVFKPDLLPPLEKAKGHAYFLYHSPDDRVCPFRMAEQAAEELKKGGATVKLVTYEGGHGWRGDVYGNIREGVEWLEKNHANRAKP
jgi:predicted esterase